MVEFVGFGKPESPSQLAGRANSGCNSFYGKRHSVAELRHKYLKRMRRPIDSRRIL